MNIKLLRQIRTMILKRPRQFQMVEYFANKDSVGHKASHCGTAACIAGWAVVLGGLSKNPRNARRQIGGDTWDQAAQLLGMPCPSGLFISQYWPEPYRTRFIDATTAKAKARVAAARINYLIKHNQ